MLDTCMNISWKLWKAPCLAPVQLVRCFMTPLAVVHETPAALASYVVFFCDLFMQISNIPQRPAGMAVPKCNNRRLHCAFEPFSTENIPVLGADVDCMVGS